MKKRIITLTIACAMLLTACSNSGDDIITTTAPQETTSTTAQDTAPATENTTESETSAEDENTEDTASEETNDNTSEESCPDNIYGPGMDKISVDDITNIEYYDGDIWNAHCEGFAYLAEPTGIGFNSIENEDLYNSAEHTFSGAPEASSAEFKRYNAGDSICGLTITYAGTDFSNRMFSEDIHPESCFTGCMVMFDGSITLTGYVVILVDEEYAVGGEGDVIFIPDNDSQILPILNYDYISKERGVYSSLPESCRTAGGVTCQSEYSFGMCGNISEYDSGMFAAIEPNTPTKVKITADNISMDSGIDWFARWGLTVTSLDII